MIIANAIGARRNAVNLLIPTISSKLRHQQRIKKYTPATLNIMPDA
jgi:hypothetical protein